MKAPAFQFYAADFLADKNVLVMSAEEVGAYWLLICVCWREGSLPDDMEELAVLARMPAEKFQASWDKRIGRCFMLLADGRWVHPRLEAEREAQNVNREKKRMAANKRHHADAGQAEESTSQSDNADAVHVQSKRTASAYQTQCPSSSSSPAKEEKPSAKAGAAAPSGRAPVSANGKSPPKPPDTVWTLGVNMLTGVGIPEQEARSFIGGLVKEHGKDPVAQAVASTSAQNPVNPKEYLVKVLKPGGIGNAANNFKRNDRADTNVSRWNDIANDPAFGFVGDPDGEAEGLDRGTHGRDGVPVEARAVTR